MSAADHLSKTIPWKREQVIVSSVELSFPVEPSKASQAEVVAAGMANPLAHLPESAWEAVAGAVINPEAVAVMLRPTAQEPTGLLLEEHVEGATLRNLNTRVWLSELLPGIQPRTGMEVMDIADPQVSGTTEDGEPCAVVRYRYRDLQHLQDHVWQTIHSTLAINSYAPSILARKVTRPLIVHPVEFAFEDGADSFTTLVVRDGITRLASAWAVLAGPDAEAADTADLMVQRLFGKVPAASVANGPRLAAVRRDWRTTLADTFSEAKVGDDLEDRGIYVAQTLVVPAQIAVGAEGHPGHLLAPEDVFDDAMRSVLASVHVEFKAWDSAAQNVEVATRALKRVIQLGDAAVHEEGLKVVYGLAVGRIRPEELPQRYGDSRLPGTALWRGIQLVHALTRPELYNQLKDQAKAIKGGSRMSAKGFAELLGPIVDLPWRSAKKAVAKQARNAWANGGVLTRDVLGEWDPVVTDDFTTLVEPALAGNAHARCTLAVAGGIALIADKLLTRNVGSSLMASREKGGVPLRADVNAVVEGLSAAENVLGLWTLALAANRFRADGLPENAQSVRQLVRLTPDGSQAPYVHLKVDLGQPDRIARDGHSVPVQMFEWDVVSAHDSARAEAAVKEHFARTFGRMPQPAAASGSNHENPGGAANESEPESAPEPPEEPKPDDVSFNAPGPEVPPGRRAADLRRALRAGLDSARLALNDLLEVDRTAGSWPPVMEPDDFDDLGQSLVGLQTDMENLRRNIQGDEQSAWNTEEDED
ncbi:hypothetical protein [Kitasatospora sp. NPDC057223]|uniref:hypothetical protein n=1 Tax=Kitasatospora sp. NPDC057223 TaxID=3346055 RepID=UPI00362DB9FD